MNSATNNLAKTLCLASALAGILACTHPTTDPSNSKPRATLDYPQARTGQQVDEYHGVRVVDPYRWLEDTSTVETTEWIAAQDRLLDEYVSEVPSIDAMTERLRQIRDLGSISSPMHRQGSYFTNRVAPGAVHGVLYRQEGLDGAASPVLDFARVISDPDHRVGGFNVSPDGRQVLWLTMAQGGWGWFDVAALAAGQKSGHEKKSNWEISSEKIGGIAGSSAIWTHDSRGFFYTTYGDSEALLADEAEPLPRIRYHLLGTDPADDRAIYSRPDRPSMLFTAKLSDDGRYLVIALMDGSRSENQVVYLDLETNPPATGDVSQASFVTLIEDADALYTFEANQGRRFFFQTTLDAPRRRVLAIDLDRPARADWQQVIPQRDQAIGSVSHIGGRLVMQSTVHARPVIELWSFDGELERTLELPAIGLVSGLSDDPGNSVAFYRMNSLIDPGTIYRVDLDSGRSEVQHQLQLSHDPADYEIRQVFYESKDGTRVPMFVAHRKDVELRGDNPLFMYGYGHGGWVAFPWYQPHLLLWMEMGGTYALPGLRGGGEYGAEWQAAGTRLNKQNSIDDYVAAAEWLIDNGYTSADKLVANGGSASGVVPAAAVIQRPDLFAAALIDFPFLDMLRYHQFTTIKGWIGGYGSADNAEDFAVLHSYSPLHQIELGTCYPPILTVVGEQDAVTVPMHGYKFTAAMQAAQGCDHAILQKHIPGAGHYSYGVTPEASVETGVEMIAFLVRALDWSSTPRGGSGEHARTKFLN